MSRPFPVILLLMVMRTVLSAQSGYTISQRITLPPLMVYGPVTDLPMAINREDVKAIGMGRAQIAKGNTFMAMTYNPALLAHGRLAIEVPSIQASLPTQTYDAMLFLQHNIYQFEQALFLTQVQEGIDAFQGAATNAEKLVALQKIETGIRFPRDLLTDVIGTSANPTTHGILVIPTIVAQVGHWGFSLHANLQSGFKLIQSSTLEALANITLPTDITNPAQVARTVSQLAAILKSVTLPNGGFSLDEALPKAYAISYADIVGSAGYGMAVTPTLSVGATLKIVNRRFSTKRLAPDTFDDILGEVRKDFKNSITGLTADIGVLYHFPRPGTDVGLSLQNIIPFKSIRSSMNGNFSTTRFDYARTGDGQFILTPQGDTTMIAYEQHLALDVPFELKLPVILNIGARQPITPQWDVALDIVDLAKQDARFERYAERLRFGMEYRLDAIDDVLGITPRVGMADLQLTLGVGVNVFRVLQIDAAYAHDSYVDSWSYFLQARLGW